MLSEHKCLSVTMCDEAKEWLLHGHWPIQPSLKLFLQLTVLETVRAQGLKSHTEKCLRSAGCHQAISHAPEPLALAPAGAHGLMCARDLVHGPLHAVVAGTRECPP